MKYKSLIWLISLCLQGQDNLFSIVLHITTGRLRTLWTAEYCTINFWYCYRRKANGCIFKM